MSDLEAVLTTGTDDVRAIIDIAAASVGPVELEPGSIHVVTVPAGAKAELIDLDRDVYRAHPRRPTGLFTVRTAQSLIDYVTKHGMDETEAWADVDGIRLTAVINAHQGYDLPAGWGDHQAVLQLQHSDEWTRWTSIDGDLVPQTEFAEFIEQRTVDFFEPAGADILELAQSFQASRSGRFESSQRLTSGETTLVWKDDVAATAGRSGQIAIPDVVELVLRPFTGADAFKVRARFRYRISDGRLLLGFALERPADVIATAFDDVVEKVREGLPNVPVYLGPQPR